MVARARAHRPGAVPAPVMDRRPGPLPGGWHPGRNRFATKPALARRMLARPLDVVVPAGWVAGDEVYGTADRLARRLPKQAW
jgi:SRSO17 transposase